MARSSRRPVHVHRIRFALKSGYFPEIFWGLYVRMQMSTNITPDIFLELFLPPLAGKRLNVRIQQGKFTASKFADVCILIVKSICLLRVLPRRHRMSKKCSRRRERDRLGPSAAAFVICERHTPDNARTQFFQSFSLVHVNSKL